MECNRLSAQLDLAPSADTTDPYFAELAAHLVECAACRKRMENRLEAERIIKAQMESMASVPDTLLALALSSAGRAHASGRRWRLLIAVAASLFLAVGLSASVYDHWKHDKAQAAVKKLCVLSIRNHEVFHALEFDSGDREAVSKWLSGRLGHLVKMPARLDIGVITGARRCALGEHAVAAVNFEIEGKRGTLFAFYPDQFGVEGITEPPKFEMGYTVAVWNENGIGYSLVSEAPAESIKSRFKGLRDRGA